jgi:hypothetical protein
VKGAERAHTVIASRGDGARVKVCLAVSVCLFAAFAFISVAGSSGVASPGASPASFAPAETFAQGETDFSKFSHASQRHASLSCSSCHRRAADNSAEPRLPGHKACTDCHLAQFVTPNIHMCAICHAGVEGENPPVKAFPGIRSFGARFDHAQHNTGDARPRQGCVACHQPAPRRSASLTIPSGLAAHRECYTCHTPQAQAAGHDIASCGVCHTLSQRFFRTPTAAPAFRLGFSHAAHGARQRLGCADCHQTRAGLAQSQQVTSTRPAEHFAAARAQTCASCHNDRRSFGDASFNDCRRCHQGQTFRAGG